MTFVWSVHVVGQMALGEQSDSVPVYCHVCDLTQRLSRLGSYVSPILIGSNDNHLFEFLRYQSQRICATNDSSYCIRASLYASESTHFNFATATIIMITMTQSPRPPLSDLVSERRQPNGPYLTNAVTAYTQSGDTSTIMQSLEGELVEPLDR